MKRYSVTWNSGYSDHLLRGCLRSGGVVKAEMLGSHRRAVEMQETSTFEHSIDDGVSEILVVNMKIAKSLGIKIPQSVLLRAERVIE